MTSPREISQTERGQDEEGGNGHVHFIVDPKSKPTVNHDDITNKEL